MIINREDAEHHKRQIDLSGPEDNAYCLLGICHGIAKQLKIDWKPISEDAMSKDYEHLLVVLDKHFGEYVDFVR